MGEPKLLLKLGNSTVISRLINVLDMPGLEATAVVIRPDDADLERELTRTAALVVKPPRSPEQMRESVEFAIADLANRMAPNDNDGWLLVPADHPMLDGEILEQLVAAWNDSDAEILVPTFDGRRGHPTFFRWRLARQLTNIPRDRGLDWLLEEFSESVTEVPVERPAVVQDLDTPEEYERLLRDWNGSAEIQ